MILVSGRAYTHLCKILEERELGRATREAVELVDAKETTRVLAAEPREQFMSRGC